MAYCSNCGNELKQGAKFCDKCGTQVKTPHQEPHVSGGTACPSCGSLIPLGNVVCPKCGNPLNQDTHTAAIVIGYICSIFLPLFGIIFGIYLLTRKNKDVHKHGIIMIVIAIVAAIFYIMLISSYLSYVNSMRHYSYYYY